MRFSILLLAGASLIPIWYFYRTQTAKQVQSFDLNVFRTEEGLREIAKKAQQRANEEREAKALLEDCVSAANNVRATHLQLIKELKLFRELTDRQRSSPVPSSPHLTHEDFSRVFKSFFERVRLHVPLDFEKELLAAERALSSCKGATAGDGYSLRTEIEIVNKNLAAMRGRFDTVHESRTGIEELLRLVNDDFPNTLDGDLRRKAIKEIVRRGW